MIDRTKLGKERICISEEYNPNHYYNTSNPLLAVSTHTTSAGEVTYEGERTKLGTWKAL
jgi:hypothetical protein